MTEETKDPTERSETVQQKARREMPIPSWTKRTTGTLNGDVAALRTPTRLNCRRRWS